MFLVSTWTDEILASSLAQRLLAVLAIFLVLILVNIVSYIYARRYKFSKVKRINAIAILLYIVSFVITSCCHLSTASLKGSVLLTPICLFTLTTVVIMFSLSLIGIASTIYVLMKKDENNFFIFKLITFLKSISSENKRNSFLARLIKIGIPLMGLFFFIGVFGVMEAYVANSSEFVFSFEDVVLPMVITFIVLCIVLILLAFFIKSAVVDLVSYFLGSVALICWLNGLLNSSSVLLGQYTFTLDEVLGGIFLLSGVLIITIIVCYFYFKFNLNTKNIAVYVSGAIMIMQFVPICTMLLPQVVNNSSEKSVENSDSRFIFSGETQFEVGSERNVVVFFMDSFSQQWLDYLEEYDPSFMQSLSFLQDDFVECKDMGVNFCNTSLAMPAELTGQDLYLDKDIGDILSSVWNADTTNYFYDTLHALDFEIDCYSEDNKQIGGSISNICTKFDNVVPADFNNYTCNSLGLYSYMSRLSLYNYGLSLYGAACVPPTTDTINAQCNFPAISGKYCIFKNDVFYNKLASDGITISNSVRNKAAFIHLWGTHQPFNALNDNSDATIADATKACLLIVDKYVSELKRLGLYDTATIILTADHGEDYGHGALVGASLGASGSCFIMKVPSDCKNRNECVNIANKKGYLPLDLLPTILDSLNLSIPDYYSGYSLLSDSFPENRLRKHFILALGDAFDPAPKYNAFGLSMYNCVQVAEYSGTIKELGEGLNSSFDVYPLYNFWY